jgi:integrase/recombinase XerD
LERSPNTQRAYATSLKLWFGFLARVGVDRTRVGVDDVARFVAWLRAPAANVIVLESSRGLRAPATVNRHLAAVFGLYEHHARAGVAVAGELTAWRRVGRGSYKPFLHHVTAGHPVPTRPVKLLVPRRTPRTLSPEQLVTVLASPQRGRPDSLERLGRRVTATPDAPPPAAHRGLSFPRSGVIGCRQRPAAPVTEALTAR